MATYYFLSGGSWNVPVNWYTSQTGGLANRSSVVPTLTDDVYIGSPVTTLTGSLSARTLTSLFAGTNTYRPTNKPALSAIAISNSIYDPSYSLAVSVSTNLHQCDLININLISPSTILSGSGSYDTLCGYITGNINIYGAKTNKTNYYLGLSTLYVKGSLNLYGDTVVVGPITATNLVSFFGNSYIDGNTSLWLSGLSSTNNTFRGTGYVAGSGYFLNGFNNGYVDYGIIPTTATSPYVYGGVYNNYCLAQGASTSRTGDLIVTKPFFNIVNSKIYDTKYNLVTSLTFATSGQYGTLDPVTTNSTANPYISSYTFLNNSSNIGFINAPCYFYNTSSNKGYIVVTPQNQNSYSSAYFYNSSFNAQSGFILQSLTSYNSQLSSYSYFNDFSYNLGTIDYGYYTSKSSNIYKDLSSTASIYGNLSGSLSAISELTATNVVFSNPGLIYTASYNPITSIVFSGTSIYSANLASRGLADYKFTSNSILSGYIKIANNKQVIFTDYSVVDPIGVINGTALYDNKSNGYMYGTVTNLIYSGAPGTNTSIYQGGVVTKQLIISDNGYVSGNTLILANNETFAIQVTSITDSINPLTTINTNGPYAAPALTNTAIKTLFLNGISSYISSASNNFTGTATLSDGAYNTSTSPYLTAYFYGASLNFGTLTNAYFYNPTNANFLIQGIILNNLYYQTDTQTLSVNGGIVYNPPITQNNGYVGGKYYDLNSNLLTAINFYDTSSSAVTAFRQNVNSSTYPLLCSQFRTASYFDNSYNNMTIASPATAYFYNNSKNYGIINYGVFRGNSSNTIAVIVGSIKSLKPTGTPKLYAGILSATNFGISNSGYFYDNSKNYGIINSSGYFYDSSAHMLDATNLLTQATVASAFNAVILSGGFVNNATFYSRASNNGIITNTAYFYGSSVNTQATNTLNISAYSTGSSATTPTFNSVPTINTTLSCYFYDASRNESNNITQTSIFNNNSYNLGIISIPSVTHNDNSYNSGTITNDAYINSNNDLVYSSGIIGGNVYYNTRQIQNQTLTLSGLQTFGINKNNNNFGQFYNSSQQLLTGLTFKDNSKYNLSKFPIYTQFKNISFYDNSTNTSKLDTVYFYNYSQNQNNGNIATGYFNDYSINRGTITTTAYFNNSSYNVSNTVVRGVFNSINTFALSNSGTITQDAYFNVQLIGDASIALSGNQVLNFSVNNNYYNYTTNSLITSFTFNDSSVLNSFVDQNTPKYLNTFYFNNLSQNNANVDYGTGYFSGSSVNNKRLQSAIFTDQAKNNGTVTYSCVLQNSAVNLGRTNILTLNDSAYNGSGAVYGNVYNNINQSGISNTQLSNLIANKSVSNNTITNNLTYAPGIISLDTINISAPIVWFEYPNNVDSTHKYWKPYYTKYIIPGYQVQIDLSSFGTINTTNNFLALGSTGLYLSTEKIYQNNKFVYPSGNSTRTYTVVFSKGTAASGRYILLGTGSSSTSYGEFSLFLDTTNNTVGVDCNGGSVSTSSWDPNNWTVLTAVVNSYATNISTIQLYVNGAPAKTTKTGNAGSIINTIYTGSSSSYELTIGARPGTTLNNNVFTNGLISSVIMYDRALTPQEIYSIYLYYKNKHSILTYG